MHDGRCSAGGVLVFRASARGVCVLGGLIALCTRVVSKRVPFISSEKAEMSLLDVKVAGEDWLKSSFLFIFVAFFFLFLKIRFYCFFFFS